jgi:hypothetical protein
VTATSSFHLFIFSSFHLFIFSSFHLFIFSSFHLFIFSSFHLCTFTFSMSALPLKADMCGAKTNVRFCFTPESGHVRDVG